MEVASVVSEPSSLAHSLEAARVCEYLDHLLKDILTCFMSMM